MPDPYFDILPLIREKRDPGGNAPGQGLTEIQWRLLIVSCAVLVTLFSLYCLSNGITIIFMHLYYFPIVLLAYRYRYRGFVLATLLALSYLSLVVLYHPEQAEVIGAIFRVFVFVGIAAVIAYLSERLVSERHYEKKSTDELLHLQQFQESVITNANVWISVLAPDGTIRIWNDAAEAISGYRKNTVTGGRSVWKWLYPDKEYRKRISAEIQRIIERDSYLENFETEIHCADGTAKTILWNTRSLREPSGAVNGYIAIGREITRRKVAEEQVRRSSEIYHEFFTTSRDCVFITTPDGRWIDFNDGALNLFGYESREELEMIPIMELYQNPSERIRLLAHIRQYGFVKEHPAQLRRKDGTIIDTLITTAPLHNDDGSLRAYIGTIRDITAWKQAEEAIRRSEREWHTTFNAINDAVFLLDNDGKILRHNQAFEALTGKTGEIIDGRYCYEFMHGTLFPIDNCPNVRAQVSRQRESLELKVNDHWFIATVDPILSDDGEISGAVHLIIDITQRKESEEVLRESEEKFRSIFNSLNDGIHLHEIEPDGSPGKFIDVNDVACRMLQYSREEMLRKSPIDFATRFHKPPIDEVLRDLNTQGYAFFETGHVRKDGTVIPVEINSHVVSFSGTKFVVSAIRDITERKKISEELHKSHLLLEAVLDSIPLGVFWKDSQLHYLGCNRVAARDAGLSKPEEVIGKTDFDLAWRSLADSYRADDTRVMNTGIPRINYEEKVIQPDGRVQWVNTNKIPLYGINDTISGVVGTYEDITKRKDAEKNLAYSNTMLRTEQETSIDGILVVDEAGKILSFNRRFMDIWGIPEDLVNSRADDPVLAYVMEKVSDPEQFLDRVRYLYDHREEKSTEEIPLKDNRVFERYSAPMIGENNTYFGRVWFFHDITGRKRAQEDLTRLNRNLDGLVQERTQALEEEVAQRKKAEEIVRASLEEKIVLLREVHHRVKNNLQILISLFNLQSRTFADPQVIAALQESVQRIRAMSMVHEKLYSGRDIARIEFINYLSSLANSQLSFYQLSPGKIKLEVNGGKIMLDINTAIPLGLVMNELVSNALKHAFPGDRRGIIRIDATEVEDCLEIIFADDGIGIPSEFDDKASKTLGLRLVNILIRQLSGTITRNLSGGGTKFTITIPFKKLRSDGDSQAMV